MKKLIALFSVVIITTAFVAQTTTNKSTAIVDQIQGIYVFIKSKPISEYEFMGSIKKTVAWSGKPAEMLNSMIKKALKEYPKCDAIIFTDVDMDKADCIKFK